MHPRVTKLRHLGRLLIVRRTSRLVLLVVGLVGRIHVDDARVLVDEGDRRSILVVPANLVLHAEEPACDVIQIDVEVVCLVRLALAAQGLEVRNQARHAVVAAEAARALALYDAVLLEDVGGEVGGAGEVLLADEGARVRLGDAVEEALGLVVRLAEGVPEARVHDVDAVLALHLLFVVADGEFRGDGGGHGVREEGLR